MAPPAPKSANSSTNAATPKQPVPGGSPRRGPSGPSSLPLASSDPNLLLDSLEALTSGRSVKGDLDPVDFLNRHYTSEPVLVTQLPSLREAVTERMEKLDERISNALQRQSETAESTRRHVQDSKASVEALEHRVRLVQEKASQSERAVLEITKDMKRLDCAKRHLQRTITTLKRLHMLIHAVEQLRLACLLKPFPDFKSASHLVDATRLLLKHFDSYTHKVEPMNLLNHKVIDLQEDLRINVLRGFRIAGFGISKGLIKMQDVNGNPKQNPTRKDSGSNVVDVPLDDETQDGTLLGSPPDIMPPVVMASGTLLIDSLGLQERVRFIDQFCNDHLQDYIQQFQPVSKSPKKINRTSSFKVVENPEKVDEVSTSGLEQVERRFVWFRDLALQINDKFPQVFPPYWNLHYSLTIKFLQLTRDHYYKLLDGPKKDKDAGNAQVLLKAMQTTIKFEKEMSAWLQRDYGTIFINPSETKSKKENSQTPESSRKNTLNKQSSSDISSPRNQDALGNNKEGGKASLEQKPVQPLVGKASTVFEKYMTPYIALEEQSMDEQLVEALEDKNVDNRGERPVFTSSTTLFVYIKGSITRCNALSKGHAFYLLYQAFQDSLRKYAQVLAGKLPSPIQSTSSVAVGGINIAGAVTSAFGKQESGTSGGSYRIPQGEEVTVCHVISTCEYCADTVEALEDLIRETIDEKYKSKIDMMAEQEAFHELTAKSIRVLVSGLSNRLEGALKMMQSINWGVFDLVGEESSYTRAIHDEIQPFVTAVRGLIPTSYFRSFCDKFATTFTSAYYEALIRLKRISELGTQQLLLDVYSLKTLFLQLPVLQALGNKSKITAAKSKVATTIAPALYTKMVQKQFNSIETLLKLIGTPVELLIDVFKVQWVGGSALDLQTVMSLKGMKRTDQAAILEKIGMDPVTALKGATVGVTGATIVSERVQALQDRGSDVAAKVNSDLNQMRQKVDDFRRAFR